MTTTISADNGSVSGSAGLKTSADSSGVLALQSGANITAVTIDASQNVAVASLTATKPVFTDASKNLTSTGTVPVANGGTGQTTANAGFNALSPLTTLGDTLYGAASGVGTRLAGNTTATKNFLVQTGTGSASAAPAWGTIAAADVPTLNQNTTGTAGNVTGTVAVANGGTGLTTTPANGALDIGNGTGFTRTTLTAGTGISVTNSAGGITITNTSPSSGGTVTSVTGTSPVASSGGTTPAISLSSGYGDTQNPYASKTANFFLAAPNGIAGVPTFRAVVAADIPTLNQNTTGTAANVSGTVAVANGGTGATTAAGARTNLGATTVGGNMFTLTNPSAITFPRFNADNTISALDAATFRTAIGAGTSSTTGTVTSVATSGTVSGITLTGGTITTTGTITLGGTLAVTPSNFASQTANTFLAAPNGAAGVPTFRAVVAADIPTLNQNTTGSSGSCTGNAATATTATNAGNVVNNSGRTDATAYPVLWSPAGGGGYQPTYSCAAVTITSSTGTLTATTFSASSDERLKTNWRDLPIDFVEQLAKVKHGTYDRTDNGVTQEGVSGQSLQNVLPHSTLADDEGMLSVVYGNAAMVSAIQLAQRVVAQDARIAKLEALVAQLLEK